MVESLENISSNKKIKKIFFIAGEHSGDLQGSIVIRHLKELMPELEITGVGGKLMKEAGMTCIHNSDEMAVIGIIEVVKNFKTLKHIKADIQNWLSDNRPDMVVLIDYPDFNNVFFSRNLQLKNKKNAVTAVYCSKISSVAFSRAAFSSFDPTVIRT